MCRHLPKVALVVFALAAIHLPAATVEHLTLDQMIQKSTAIVRGKAVSSRTMVRGAIIYTLHQIQVAERWKGAAGSRVEIAVPGGVANGLRQKFSGAPDVTGGSEYVLFLWTGKNGVTHVIGLSQGVLNIQKNAKGEPVVARLTTAAHMVDSAGRPMSDQPLQMTLPALDAYIRRVLGEVTR